MFVGLPVLEGLTKGPVGQFDVSWRPTFSPALSTKNLKKMWEKERQVNDGRDPRRSPDFSPDISVDRPFLSVGVRILPPPKIDCKLHS